MSGVEQLLRLIGVAIYIFSWLIIARALLSWFPDARNHPAVDLLHQITDPVILPIQKIVPRIGMLDISPMIAFVVLQVVAGILGIRTF